MLQTFTLTIPENVEHAAPPPGNWAIRAALLWRHRRMLTLATAIAFAAGLGMSLVIPKQYKSAASIMPPDQQSSGTMMLAALAARGGSLGTFSNLASSLLGGRTTSALFIDLLRSGTVSGHLIDRFNLQHVYHTRYRIDTAKHLARCTAITEDKKSGVITVEVKDLSPTRARDLAQGYLDELNNLVARTNTSAAHRERVFIEQRLSSVKAELERAQLDLSEFSSRNTTVDIKEQTRAMVDAGARVQGELLFEQSELESLRQIYGDGNIRVRETEARIATLKSKLDKMVGSSAEVIPEANDVSESDSNGQLYPPLRQLPRLAVPYADLYRRVAVQETVFELLTQQYEMARIEEAKDIPVVSVIDSPGVPEKKSFPPRTLITLGVAAFGLFGASAYVILRERWSKVDSADPRKVLAEDVLLAVRSTKDSILRRSRRAV